MTDDPAVFDRDADHLRLLRVFHYVYGGMTVAFSSLFLIHLAFISTMTFHPDVLPMPQHNAPPREIWLILAAMICMFILLSWTIGILTIVSGRRMGKLRSRTFSIVIACLNCLSFPFGTALGVCTLIVLMRPSVTQRYAASQDPFS